MSAVLARRSAIGLALAGCATAARAQPAFPNRPIRLVVPFAAGSATDIRARLFGQQMSADWGQPVVVDNRGGANGFLAAEAVARAAPDGYTLLFTSNSTHGSNPALFRRLPYDPIADFAPISLIGVAVNFVVVNNALPIRTLRDLIDYAKAHPGALNFASGSASSRAAGELFKSMAGVAMTNVAYRANPQALTDVVAGNAQVMFADSTTVTPQIREGRVRALAVTSRQRAPTFPDIPTVEEAGGLAGYEMLNWAAVYAPAGTPPDIVARLNGKFVELAALPAIRDKLREDGTEPRTSTPEELARFTASEIAKWREIVAAARIEVE
ncbi:Bug family tripartite tricarboxylate transporter substrate binding protein [Muricoccus radiodurans]|uniref:Bug family tripartite tricarboxylate transporter substrate binding protein n=1 Tax=Muricoccus radiodurans TaxID=2231721 RepID=UPI003CED4BB1